VHDVAVVERDVAGIGGEPDPRGARGSVASKKPSEASWLPGSIRSSPVSGRDGAR
jgi:hypothetical protein